MSLPNVAGWLIDFRTARAIFVSKSNERIDHCVDMCGRARLFGVFCEKKDFLTNLQMRSAFVDDSDAILVPDNDVYARSLDLSMSAIGRRRMHGNESAISITAFAASRNFGVISDHRSPKFATVFDICSNCGIPVLSADDYFAGVFS